MASWCVPRWAIYCATRFIPRLHHYRKQVQKSTSIFKKWQFLQPVADPRGRPLRTKIFLISCSFLGEIWQICMLVPPPTRNPGSAPDNGHVVNTNRVQTGDPRRVWFQLMSLYFRACCGQGFSVFSSDNGIVMTCGDGTSGCLGHGDWCSTSRPRLIEDLLRWPKLLSGTTEKCFQGALHDEIRLNSTQL